MRLKGPNKRQRREDMLMDRFKCLHGAREKHNVIYAYTTIKNHGLPKFWLGKKIVPVIEKNPLDGF